MIRNYSTIIRRNKPYYPGKRSTEVEFGLQAWFRIYLFYLVPVFLIKKHDAAVASVDFC
jgi:hypothetical protein